MLLEIYLVKYPFISLIILQKFTNYCSRLPPKFFIPPQYLWKLEMMFISLKMTNLAAPNLSYTDSKMILMIFINEVTNQS